MSTDTYTESSLLEDIDTICDFIIARYGVKTCADFHAAAVLEDPFPARHYDPHKLLATNEETAATDRLQSAFDSLVCSYTKTADPNWWTVQNGRAALFASLEHTEVTQKTRELLWKRHWESQGGKARTCADHGELQELRVSSAGLIKGHANGGCLTTKFRAHLLNASVAVTKDLQVVTKQLTDNPGTAGVTSAMGAAAYSLRAYGDACLVVRDRAGAPYLV